MRVRFDLLTVNHAAAPLSVVNPFLGHMRDARHRKHLSKAPLPVGHCTLRQPVARPEIELARRAARYTRERRRHKISTALPKIKDEVMIRKILKQWGDKTTGEILDYVYFQTAPMETAIRNQPLDFSATQLSSGTKYERAPSGATQAEIKKLKAQFETRRTERAGLKAKPDLTPPNYDEDFEKAMTILQSLDA